MSRRLTTVVLFALAFTRGNAQTAGTRRADSLIAHGMLEQGESILYAAAREHPRDPQARSDLGAHLVSRGAVRIGATLLEEAIRFGGDKRTNSIALAGVYEYLGDYEALSKLPWSPLSVSGKRRNTWLIAHPTRAIAPDSMTLVAYTRPVIDDYVGTTTIRINGRPVSAMIEPAMRCKIKMSDTSGLAKNLHLYAADSVGKVKYAAAVADSIGYGRLTLTNVPVTVQHLDNGVQAIVCLGALMPFAPTFDPKAGRITLRLSGSVPRHTDAASAFPFYAPDGQVSLVKAGGLASIRSMLFESRWTLDVKRGQIVVEP